MVVEVEKSHNLPYASWRLWKTRNQSEYDGLSTCRAEGVNPSLRSKTREPGGCWCKYQDPKSWEPGALMMSGVKEKMDFPDQEERKHVPLPHLFVPFRLLTNWMLPTHDWWGQIYHLVAWMKCCFLTDAPRNNVVPASKASLRSVKLTRKISHDRNSCYY